MKISNQLNFLRLLDHIPTASRSHECSVTKTNECVTMSPLAATTSTPLPEKFVSTQNMSCGTGIECPKNVPLTTKIEEMIL